MKRIIITLIFVISCVSMSIAQKINIGYIYPTGAQRGSEQIIAIGGQSIATAKSVIVSGKGVHGEILPATPVDKKKNKRKKGKISDEDNLQLAQNVKVKITVDKDAELGIRDLKVVGATGVISNNLYFEVGEYCDFVEAEPNNSFSEATHIDALPATINGYIEKSKVIGSTEQGGGGETLERGGKDIYSFDASKGEVIVAEVKGRRFVPYLADAVPGWFQAVISIFDERGQEVAYCDDFQLRVDPVIIFEVPQSGKYFLKIHDSIYRGREDFVYRINLGTIPFVTSAYPLGSKSQKRSEVEIRGVNLGGKSKSKEIEQIINTTLNLSGLEPGIQEVSYTNPKTKLPSNKFSLNIVDTPKNLIIGDEEVGRSITTSRLITFDESINSKIETPGDEDWYCFDMAKNGNVIISVLGRKLLSPIDAKLTIYDSKGKKIKEVDDVVDPSQGLLTHHADPEASIKIPEAGRYFIRITETQNKGGEEFSYQLNIKRYEPDFDLNIEPSSLSIPQGGTSIFTLFAVRKYNFMGKIDLRYEGLPEDFEVSATQYAGKSKAMKIAITAPEDAPIGALGLKVLGVSTKGNEEVIKEAKPSQVMTQAFYIDHLLQSSEFRVDITPAEPFTISLEPVEGDAIQLRSEGFTPIKVVVKRKEGFDDEIQIMKKMLPQGIFFSSITIPKGANEGIIQVECPYWKPQQKIAKIMLLATVKSSTNNRVAGQARNTINAAVMVNSPYTDVLLPKSGTPISQKELKKLIKLKK